MALFRRGYVRGGIILLLVVSLVLLWAAPCFAVAIADDILVAVVLAFLAASGVTLSFAAGSASQSDVVGVMMGKLGEFATSQGSSIADLFPAAGAWFANGLINVSQGVGNALSGFLAWLKGPSVGLVDNSAIILEKGLVNFGALDCYKLTVGTVLNTNSAPGGWDEWTAKCTITEISQPDVYFGLGQVSGTSADYCWNFFASKDATVTFRLDLTYSDGRTSSGSYRVYVSRTTDIFYEGNGLCLYNVTPPIEPTFVCNSGGKVITPSASICGGSVSAAPDIGIGADTITSIPPVESGYDVVIGSPAIGADAGTLQGAADDVLGHVVENAGDLTGSLELVEQGTVTPPGPDEPEHEDNYPVVGLETIFPFCIPFDLYEFFSVLDADPVAPSFTWTADFPDALGGPQEITIDFDTPEWNAAARVLRTLELLAFIVGLMVITRKLIRG